MDSPSIEQVDAAITAFGKLGLKVMITELDVDVLPLAFQYMGADVTLSAELQPKLNPYAKGLPDCGSAGAGAALRRPVHRVSRSTAASSRASRSGA